jgi:uncharacterized protein (DUF1778 family)
MRLDDAMPDQIRIRITHDEKRLLMEAERRRGQTLSDLLRTSATEAAKRVALAAMAKG